MNKIRHLGKGLGKVSFNHLNLSRSRRFYWI